MFEGGGGGGVFINQDWTLGKIYPCFLRFFMIFPMSSHSGFDFLSAREVSVAFCLFAQGGAPPFSSCPVATFHVPR